MARPTRNNADYFTHTADLRNDRRVKAIRARFGVAGYGLLIMLMEVLTDADFIQISTDELELELLAGDLGVSATEIDSLIQLAEKIGFFARNESGNLICPDLNRVLEPVFEKRNRARNASFPPKPQQPDTETPDSNTGNGVSVTETQVSTTENTQSKVKESKEEESKEKKSKTGNSSSHPQSVEGANTNPKKRSLDERKEAFAALLMEHMDAHPKKYPNEMYRNFFNYWTETNGKKMRFEMEKIFELSKRLATWHSNQKNFRPAIQKPKAAGSIIPQTGYTNERF